MIRDNRLSRGLFDIGYEDFGQPGRGGLPIDGLGGVGELITDAVVREAVASSTWTATEAGWQQNVGGNFSYGGRAVSQTVLDKFRQKLLLVGAVKSVSPGSAASSMTIDDFRAYARFLDFIGRTNLAPNGEVTRQGWAVLNHYAYMAGVQKDPRYPTVEPVASSESTKSLDVATPAEKIATNVDIKPGDRAAGQTVLSTKQAIIQGLINAYFTRDYSSIQGELSKLGSTALSTLLASSANLDKAEADKLAASIVAQWKAQQAAKSTSGSGAPVVPTQSAPAPAPAATPAGGPGTTPPGYPATKDYTMLYVLAAVIVIVFAMTGGRGGKKR